MVSCDKCPDAACCRDVTVGIDDPETIQDWDEIRWMISHHNVSVYKDNDEDWVVEFNTDCTKLNEDNTCQVYKTRPKMCRDHENDSCIYNGEGDVHEIRFDTVEQVEEHIKNQIKPKMLQKAERELAKLKAWME